MSKSRKCRRTNTKLVDCRPRKRKVLLWFSEKKSTHTSAELPLVRGNLNVYLPNFSLKCSQCYRLGIMQVLLTAPIKVSLLCHKEREVMLGQEKDNTWFIGINQRIMLIWRDTGLKLCELVLECRSPLFLASAFTYGAKILFFWNLHSGVHTFGCIHT